jgi:hypothetical protein
LNVSRIYREGEREGEKRSKSREWGEGRRREAKKSSLSTMFTFDEVFFPHSLSLSLR